MAQVGFKLMEWPAFGSNFPVNGLNGFGGMWSSWQHEKRENFGRKVDRTLWHGSSWAPADGMDSCWLKFLVNSLTEIVAWIRVHGCMKRRKSLVKGLTRYSGMDQLGFRLMEQTAFGLVFRSTI
ncbi:hypothetical protein Nepgr_015737 [Nepenthes gracilis]|uniref:Uncharacterized protein n=1 Tax=Nepenthes gracilis TaxID=150966 RepID=A0AAD3SP11_NEPGR|nr:hypothetical protein Nepgr_015737 [Nepenthes gracilis]